MLAEGSGDLFRRRHARAGPPSTPVAWPGQVTALDVVAGGGDKVPASIAFAEFVVTVRSAGVTQMRRRCHDSLGRPMWRRRDRCHPAEAGAQGGAAGEVD